MAIVAIITKRTIIVMKPSITGLVSMSPPFLPKRSISGEL